MSDIVRILDQSKETQDVESLPPAPAEIRQVDEQNSDAITELFKTQGKTPADMEAMALASGNEKEFYSKVASSLYYSKALNLNVGFVWDHFDQVQKNYRGRAMPAESDWKAIGNEYESGWLSIDMGKEYNTLMSLRDQLKDAENFKKWNIASQGGIAGSADQTFNQDVWSSPGNVGQYTPQERNPEYLQARLLETQAKIDELKKRRDVIPVDLTDRGLVISAAKAASQFMPSIMDTLPSAVLAGVLTGGGSLIAQGGMAGVRALGLKAGAKAVMQAGAGAAEATGFAKGYQLEGGLAYGDMVEAGVPHEIASQYSQMIGVINGSLEMAQIGTLGGLASPATKGLIEWAVKQGTERAVNKGLLAAGAIRFASRWAAGTIESTGQEVAQEVSSIIFEEAAKALANSKYAADIPMKTWDETLNQLKDVAIGAFLGSAVIGLPGSVVGHMTEGHPKAVKEKAQAVAKELEGVDPRIVAAQIAKTIQEPEVDQVQAFMDKQETEPTVLQEDGSPIVYYTAGASLEGIKLFRNPEDAALEADKTTRIPSPETVLEAIKTKYGPEVAREAEQGQGEAASILQAAKDKAPAWSEFHKVDITAEPAKMAMVYADVKDLAQVRMDEDGNVTLQGAGAVVPAGTIQAGELIAPQGAKIEAKAGKITLEAGGQVSEAHYRDTAEGRVIDQLPENPAHARAILKQNAGAKVNVTQDQLAQVLDTRERRSLEKQMDRLSEAESQARAEYNQAEDKEAARPALEAALADIEAQRSSIIDQMMTHDRELVGDEALRPTQATEDEYRADLTQKMRDAAPEGITNEMIAAYADLMNVRAQAMGLTLAEWGRRYLGADPFRDGTAAGNRGSVTFDDGKAVITFAEKSDPTTFVHEFGHIIRRQLADEDQAALLKHYGHDGWTRDAEEAFAHDFEAVFLEGEIAPKGLEAIFRKIVYWFRQVYRGIRGQVSAEVRVIIDRAFVSDSKRAGMSQAEAEAELYQRAWHGSPHRFDKFTTKAMGTGEGAQAFGWGLYFAGDKSVAEYYKETLSELYYYEGNRKLESADEINAAGFIVDNNGDKKAAIELILDTFANKEKAHKIIDIINGFKGEIKTGKGQLYEVEIPDHDEYLDWDKPINEQSEKVREAINGLFPSPEWESIPNGRQTILNGKQVILSNENNGITMRAATDEKGTSFHVVKLDAKSMDEAIDRINKEWAIDDKQPGRDIYHSIEMLSGSPMEASLKLKDAGIPGIRFLDGSSRSKGEGSHNYVIFADEDVQIVDTLYQPAGDTNSPEFKAWFGDSVVTEDGKPGGKPLVVYHGGSSGIEAFDGGKIGDHGRAEGPGFYFTDDKETAQGYAQYGALYETYLSIKKPLDYKTKSFTRGQIQKFLKAVAMEEESDTGTSWKDGYLSNFEYTYDGTIDTITRKAAESFVNEETAIDQISGLIGAGVDAETVNKGLFKALGYDGFISNGFSGEGIRGGNIYVAMFPTQIKSVDNTGTWNPEDPRILYQPEKPTQFETNRLAKEIELASKGILPSGAEITFGNTPIVLQKSGLESRSLVMKQSKLLSGMKPASESHGHNLTSQDYLKAQSGIWNPVFVLQSDTVPGAFVVVTEEKDLSNDYLIASINPDDNRHKPANVITSVYGKSNLSNMIERAFESGMVIYRNTEKETALLQTIGLQLSKVAYWAAKNKYITQDDVFKSKDELFQPTIYAERNRQLLDQIAHYEAEHMAGKDRSAELAELRGRLADNREAWRDDLHRALDQGEAIDASELAEFPEDPRLDQAAFDYFMAADTFGDAQAEARETVAQGRTRDQILEDFRKELPERLQRIKEISGAAYFGRFGQHDRRMAAFNLSKAQFTKTGKLRDSKWYRDRQKDFDQKWGDDDAIMEEEQARGGWKVPNRIRFDLDLGEAVKVYLESKDGTDEKGRDLLTRAIQTIEKNLEHYAWNMAYASGDFDLMAELWAADQSDPEGAAALDNAAEEKKAKRQEAKDLGKANAIERIEALKDRLAGRSLRKMTDDELTRLDRDIKAELKKLESQIHEKDREIKYLDSKYSDAASAGLKYLDQVKDLKAQIAKGDKQATKLLAKIKKEHQAGLDAAKAAREAGQARVEAGRTELHDVTKSAREEARMNARTIKNEAEAKKTQALAELRELYAIKEKKLSFARLIMKKPGRNVDATYAVHILDIQEFFSGVRNLQRAKTIQRKIKLFAEAQPQTFATLPIEIQEIVLNTRVEAWTVDQLEALHMQLEALKSKGKQVYAERVEAEKQAVAGIVYRLRKSLLAQDAGAEARGPKIREESNKAREFLLSITDPQMAFDTLDGGAGYRGAFMTEIHDAMAEKKAAAYEKILERKAQAKEQMKALGIKETQRFDWLMVEDRPVIITQGNHAYRLTLEEATGIYMLSQNEKSLKALLEGNRIPEAVIDQVKAYLPTEWKALGDWIIEHGYGDHTDRLADVYYRLNNEYMGREERYSPMVRRDISGSQLAEDMKDEIARRNMQKKTPQKGFTQGRIEIGKRFQSAIRIDALTLYNEMVDKQEIFMNLAPVIRRFNSVFGKGSPELKTAIANTHGSEYVKYINEWIARTANTSTPRSATERFIMQARGNLSAAMLGYQVGSAIKQVSGLALTMGEMRNPFRYLASIPGTLATFRASYAEMIKQSPELAHRTIDPSVFTANSSHSKLGFMAMKFRDSGFAMQQWMDTLTVTTGWTAMYQENLSQGMDEKTAARQATNAINRTQPTSDAMENSPIMADKGAIAVFTGFGSATSKIWNNLAHLPDFRRASEVTRYMLRVGSIALSALAFATIGNLGWPDDEDEDKKGKFWKGVMMDASFGNLPILGSPLKAAASGYESRYPLLGGIFEAIKKLSGIDGDMTDQQMYSTMDSVFEAGSLLTGAPYLQLKRLFTGLTQDENTVEKAMKMIIFGRA